MKKGLIFIFAAAAMAVACDPDEKTPVEDPVDDNTVTYGGVTYNTVTLENGQTWIAEPLRYVPEGKTVSDDPTSDSGIWFPYTCSLNEDGKTIDLTVEKAPASIANLGYLYDLATALGVKEVTEDNAKTFEGAQGICPDGWHIPTFDELFALVGICSKLSASFAGYNAGDTPKNSDALFYDETYNGGNIASMKNSGFDVTFSGTRNLTMYIKGVAAYPDRPMSYIWGSSFYSKTTSGLQFMSLMTTSTATYPEGRLSIAFENVLFGSQVRCIKDGWTAPVAE